MAFEYGVILAEVAKENNIELTPELMKKAETMLIGEFGKETPLQLSIDTIPNILSVFELDITK